MQLNSIMRIRHLFEVILVIGLAFISGCGKPGSVSDAASVEVYLSEIYGVELTKNLTNLHSVSWTDESTLESGTTEIVLLEVAGQTSQLTPFLTDLRKSPLYLADFSPVASADYQAKAQWWQWNGTDKYEFARFTGGDGKKPRSLNLFIRDDGTSVTIFASSTRRK